MTQIWALRSRLEKQPTDLRRRHHYLRDGTLAQKLFFCEVESTDPSANRVPGSLTALKKSLYRVRIRNPGRDEPLVVLLFPGKTARGQESGAIGLDRPVELVEGGLPSGSALPVKDPVSDRGGKVELERVR